MLLSSSLFPFSFSFTSCISYSIFTPASVTLKYYCSLWVQNILQKSIFFLKIGLSHIDFQRIDLELFLSAYKTTFLNLSFTTISACSNRIATTSPWNHVLVTCSLLAEVIYFSYSPREDIGRYIWLFPSIHFLGLVIKAHFSCKISTWILYVVGSKVTHVI